VSVVEHEFEPQHGLPQALPAGERMLWQGAPDARRLALRVFHLRALALYFAALMAWRGSAAWLDGAGWIGTGKAVLLAAALAAVAIGLLGGIAWLVARTTVYTLTDRRVVMRIGVVLSVTFNLPLRQLDAVRLRCQADGSGDVALGLASGQRIAYLHLWPHARPWRFTHPEPMLRALPDASAVATQLSDALARAAAAETGAPLRAVTNAPRRAEPSHAAPWPRAA